MLFQTFIFPTYTEIRLPAGQLINPGCRFLFQLESNTATIQDIPASISLADHCITDDTNPLQYSLGHSNGVAPQPFMSFLSVSHVALSLTHCHTWGPRLPSYEQLEF